MHGSEAVEDILVLRRQRLGFRQCLLGTAAVARHRLRAAHEIERVGVAMAGGNQVLELGARLLGAVALQGDIGHQFVRFEIVRMGIEEFGDGLLRLGRLANLHLHQGHIEEAARDISDDGAMTSSEAPAAAQSWLRMASTMRR